MRITTSLHTLEHSRYLPSENRYSRRILFTYAKTITLTSLLFKHVCSYIIGNNSHDFSCTYSYKSNSVRRGQVPNVMHDVEEIEDHLKANDKKNA